MVLEIALDTDEEWDSSRPWAPLVRKATEAAIAESAFPDLAMSGRPVEISLWERSIADRSDTASKIDAAVKGA